METSGVESSSAERLMPGGRRNHFHAAAFQDAAQGEDVAHVVVDYQHGLANEVVIGAMQAFDHLLLLLRKIGDNAMQE